MFHGGDICDVAFDDCQVTVDGLLREILREELGCKFRGGSDESCNIIACFDSVGEAGVGASTCCTEECGSRGRRRHSECGSIRVDLFVGPIILNEVVGSTTKKMAVRIRSDNVRSCFRIGPLS